MVFAVAAQAQQAPRVVTFAELERNRAAWAGDIVRIDRVMIFGFAQYSGGLVRDATSGAKLDDAGMTPRTIYQLERFCSRASNSSYSKECRGSLIFKVTLREEHRGGFTIREAEFIPE
ncbi:MAG TPA: hypothetical protein VGN82_14215 [Bosea sp. (in: a-proteobacteria)]|uniref:hypothetical protein n=1 Tax=Bosea sp. (in: a-proteobacteria) TaxID=1871050 RepID=UPI002E0FC5FD|nr:hypothetical protein [Bosea sp. (in: a-proteobacteria)]